MQKARRGKQRRCWPWREAQSYRGYTENTIARAPRLWRSVLREFATWLEKERDLALSSITLRVTSARTFVAGIAPKNEGGIATLREIGVAEIEDSFVDYGHDHGPAARRSMQSAMRLLLAFAASRGWVAEDLAEAVPSLRVYRLSSVPRSVCEREVRQLILWLTTRASSARDRAILLLCLCYGVRRGQVCALELEDIDWRARTITIRAHKGGKQILHALLPAVASAIGEYMRSERQKSETTRVFLRSRSPHGPLGPMAVTQIVHAQMRRAGVKSPRGPHALRHAFAERLLRVGEPLKSIADLLGHRSLSAVSIYAKVDLRRLIEVALEWPEARS